MNNINVKYYLYQKIINLQNNLKNIILHSPLFIRCLHHRYAAKKEENRGGGTTINKKKQRINLAINCFTHRECIFLAKILTDKFNLRTSVIKGGKPNQ